VAKYLINMYINLKELCDLETAVNKLQDIIELQNVEQNRYFIEGIWQAREDANTCEEHIETIRNREILSKARKIIRKRALAKNKA
jgi:hypothetical protein